MILVGSKFNLKYFQLQTVKLTSPMVEQGDGGEKGDPSGSGTQSGLRDRGSSGRSRGGRQMPRRGKRRKS